MLYIYIYIYTYTYIYIYIHTCMCIYDFLLGSAGAVRGPLEPWAAPVV